MPSAGKDAETNARFKQLLLRPRARQGPGHCLDCNAALDKTAPFTYTSPWRLFEARQLALAGRADAKIAASKKYLALQGAASLRSFWLPGAIRGGVVRGCLLPLPRRVAPPLADATLS